MVKRLLTALGLLVLVAAASRNPTYTRLEKATFPFVQVGSSTGAAIYTHGSLLTPVAIRSSAAAVYNHFTWTTTLAQPSFPSAIKFRIYDDASNSNTYTCSEVKITGITSFGEPVQERLSRSWGTSTPLTETATTSRYAYIRLDKIEVTGCLSSNGSSAFDSTDAIRVSMSGRYVGFPSPIAKHGANSTDTIIKSVCWSLLAGTEQSYPCFNKADLYKFKLDPNYNTIDLLSGYFGANTHDNANMAGVASLAIINGMAVNTFPTRQVTITYLKPVD